MVRPFFVASVVSSGAPRFVVRRCAGVGVGGGAILVSQAAGEAGEVADEAVDPVEAEAHVEAERCTFEDLGR